MNRWIFGFGGAIFVAALLYYLPLEAIHGLVLLLALIGFREYVQLALPHISKPLKIAGGLFVAGLCVFILFVGRPELYPFVIFGLLALTCFLFFSSNTNFDVRFRDLSIFFFGIFYCGFLFSFLGLIRALDRWPFWLLVLLAATFLADTGGYIFGRWLGKHKLAPQLSPGKTIEGFIGGWLFAIIATLIVRALFWPQAPLVESLALASVIAFVGPLGDLSESLMKRAANVKDSGKFLPGHGGLLDRVDALLFAAPCVYFFARYIF